MMNGLEKVDRDNFWIRETKDLRRHERKMKIYIYSYREQDVEDGDDTKEEGGKTKEEVCGCG